MGRAERRLIASEQDAHGSRSAAEIKEIAPTPLVWPLRERTERRPARRDEDSSTRVSDDGDPATPDALDEYA